MRRLGKLVGLVLLALFVLAGGLGAWAWYELRANSARIREAYSAGLERVRPAFLEDQALATTHPLLAPAGRTKDAGPVLNPRIGWDADSQRIRHWREGLPERPAPLALDEALTARIPKDWLSTPAEVWRGLDFSWMAELAPYDHWDVEANSPWAAEGGDEFPNGFPLIFELFPWLKLRLAKGIAKGQPSEAIAEVRHVAALLLSTETLVGSAGGLAALGFVDEALSSLEHPGRAIAAPDDRLDQEAHARAWRATMAARGFLLAEAPAALHADAERIMVGRCAALNEAVRGTLALRLASGEPVHWLPLDGPVAAACRLTWVRRTLASGRIPEAATQEAKCGEEGMLGRLACRAAAAIPALDRAIGREVMVQMLLANASPAQLYEARAAAPALPATADAATLMLALGLFFVLISPPWALLWWAATSPQQLRALARSALLKLQAVACWIVSAATGAIGSIWVNNVLIGKQRVELHRLIDGGLLVQVFLLGLAVLIVASRLRADGDPMAAAVSSRRSLRGLAVMLAAWAAAAALVVAIALGPLAGSAAERLAWRALALALVVVAALGGLLAQVSRTARRGTTGPAADSTRGT